MNLLDENFPDDQMCILRQWKIAYRQIGHWILDLGARDGKMVVGARFELAKAGASRFTV